MGLIFVPEHLNKLLEYGKAEEFKSEISGIFDDATRNNRSTLRKFYYELPNTGRRLIREVYRNKRTEKLFLNANTKLRGDKIELINQLAPIVLHHIKGKNHKSNEKKTHYLVCPTGWGKTTFIEGLIHEVKKKVPCARFLFVVSNNTTLLEQTANRFCFPNIVTHYSRSEPWERKNLRVADIVVASLQSIVQKLDGNTKIKHDELHPDEFDCVVIDEIHNFIHNLGERYMGFSKNAAIIGLTATPFQGVNGNEKFVSNIKINGEALGAPFKAVYILDEIENEHLCSIDYCRFEPKLKETVKAYLDDEGEFVFDQSQNRKRSEAAIDLYCSPKETKYNKKKALFFCVDKSHAIETNRMLASKGVKSACVISGNDGTIDSIEEAAGLLKEGTIEAIACVNRLNEGFDLPEIELLFMLRPTRSARLYLQQIGRGLRVTPTKKIILVVDIAENYEVNGQRITACDLPATLADVEGSIANFEIRMKKAVLISEKKQEKDGRFVDTIRHSARLKEQIMIGKNEPKSSPPGSQAKIKRGKAWKRLKKIKKLKKRRSMSEWGGLRLGATTLEDGW